MSEKPLGRQCLIGKAGLYWNAPRDELLDLLRLDGGHHLRHGLGGAEPVAVVVATGVVAYVVQVAEHEGHSRESLKARAGCT